MVYWSSTLFLSALLVHPAWAHMNMVTPPPRRGENNRNYPHGVDYDLASPLGYDKGYPCGGAPRGPPVATYRAGSSISIDVDGSATHDGGHCQFAISYDDCETFVVLKTIMSNCLTETGLHFEIPLPPSAPSSDHAVISWSWINKTGNREYYMNCADVRIRGVEGGYIEGPELLVANLPGFPTIPEFTGGGYRGEDLFNQRRLIKVTGNGGGSPIVQIPQIITRDVAHSNPNPRHSQGYSKSYDDYYDDTYNKNYGNSYDKGHHNLYENVSHSGPKYNKGYDKHYNEHYDNSYNDHHEKSYNKGHYDSYKNDYSDNGHFDYTNETYGNEYDNSYSGSYEDDYESYDHEYADNEHFNYSNETYGDEYDDSYNGTYEEYADINSSQHYGQDYSHEPESYAVIPAPTIHNEYIPPSGTYIAGVDTYINPIKNQIGHHYPGSDCDELQHKIGDKSYHATAPHHNSNPHPQTPAYAADQGYNLSQSPQVFEPIEYVKEAEPLLVNSSPNNYY